MPASAGSTARCTGSTVEGQGLKVPHMGWNELAPQRTARIRCWRASTAGAHAYFVHSYHLALRDPSDVLATTEYGGTMLAVVGRDNIAGTQFHPEKSQEAGLRLIANFLRWRP